MSFASLGLTRVLLLLAASSAIIFFLYWLKPPPQRVVVPSTLIWGRVLKERKRRSDFWRWLVSLLIALTVGAALVSSLGRPAVEALSGRARRIAVVLDNSPTMTAETSSGASRWELALGKARQLLDAGSPASEYLVTDTAGQLPATGFVSRRRAEGLLDRLRPELEGRVEFPVNDPLLRDTDGTEIYFIGDGVLVEDVPAHVETISVFEPAENVGITAFDLRPVPAEPTRYEGFLELSNGGSFSKRVAMQIDGAGGASVSSAVTLGAGEVRGQSVDVDNFVSGPIRVLIDAPKDAFALDNVAYAYLASPRRVTTVLVTAGNPYLETLLGLDPRIALETVSSEEYAPPDDAGDAPDLYVFDRFAPDAPPLAPALLFRPRGVSWLPSPTGGDMTELSLSGVKSEHPLMKYVSLEDVVVERAAHVDPGKRLVVVGTREQPVIVAGENPVRWVELTFDLAESNFPVQEGFPIFLMNAVSWLTTTEVTPAGLGTITLSASKAVVTNMRGETIPTRSLGDKTAFTPRAPGLYSVRTLEGSLVVAANLLSPKVSGINQSAFAGESARRGLFDHLTGSVGGGELWLILVSFALVLVLVEWWTYHHRMTV